MQILPNGKSQFIDSAGQPLASGSVGFYNPGTLNPKPTYQDSAGTIANPNPVPLDSRGQAIIWGSGVYRQILKDASGVTIWDQITEDSNAGLTGNITDAKFVAGTDFTPGTTTQLTLPVAPGGASNMWVFFDAAYQADDQLSVNGLTLTFNSPIPVGVQEVNVKIGSTIAVGTPGAGTVNDSSIAAGSKVANRSAMWFDVKDYGAKGNGTTDDTACIQAAMNAANVVGGICYFSQGTYLCGQINVNLVNGGAIIGEKGASTLIPNAANITFFNCSNSTVFKYFTVRGLTFNNQTSLAGVTGIAISNYYQFEVKDLIVRSMAYVISAQATTQSCYNLSIGDIEQYGTGSFFFKATAPFYCFDTQITNISHFTSGGDTWTNAFFTFQRNVNVVMSNVHCQAMDGIQTGIHCIGDCQGVFMSNVILVLPGYGLLMDTSNGDVAKPSWIYASNFAIDQPKIVGAALFGQTLKFSNCNFTFGALQANTGPGVQVLTGCSDVVFEGLEIQNMYHDGIQIQGGCSNVRFFGANVFNNALSGSGFDLDLAANNARDPFFSACNFGTISIIGNSTLLNGGSTSRYVFSSRTQISSNGGTNQVVVAYSLPGGSLVNGKSLRITSSGAFAANTNAKSITVSVGGINAASMNSSFNGVAYKLEAEVLRIDANNVWLTGITFAGSASNVTSGIQSPFDTVDPIVIQLVFTTTAAADILMHHFDVELVD